MSECRAVIVPAEPDGSTDTDAFYNVFCRCGLVERDIPRRSAETAAAEHTAEHHRAQQLALSLLQLGESPVDTGAQLLRWGYAEATARSAVAWAESVAYQQVEKARSETNNG